MSERGKRTKRGGAVEKALRQVEAAFSGDPPAEPPANDPVAAVDPLVRQIEAMLFAATEPLSVARLAARLPDGADIAGALAAPMRNMASLLKAVPQSFAYGLSALIDSKGGPVAAASPVVAEPVAETPAGVEDAVEAASDDVVAEVTYVAGDVEAQASVDTETSASADEAPAAEPAE